VRSANKIKIFIPIVCVLCALLFACENPWMAEILQEKTITFNSNGGSYVPSQTLYKGERVKRPVDPVKAGAIFLGWYEENSSLYDFNFIPTNSMTLYARWNENKEPVYIFNSVDDLSAFLEGQPSNTSDNPYKVKLNVSDILNPNGNPISVVDGSIAEIISNAGKYVSLELTGDNITSIGEGAFGNCTSLTSVTIPNGVTEIGQEAFSCCTSLTKIDIPNSVIKIDNATFGGCTSLTSIKIPDSVEIIGGWAFDGCTSLTSVTFNGTILSGEFGNFAFPGDLCDKYLSSGGGIGTYTRSTIGTNPDTWIKQP